MAKPILKWAGGKRQISGQVTDAFPPAEEINQYHEPFFGGGAVFFEEGHKNPGTVNDINKRLMNFYRVVKDPAKVDDLIEILQTEFRRPGEETDASLEYSEERNYYYQQRDLFNKRPRGKEFDPIWEAARLLYLNVTCYNGLYRENQSGEFNVPWNQNNANTPWAERTARIMRAHEVLQDTTIHYDDYEYIVDKNIIEPGDVAYFDPPYDTNTDSSSFDQYHFEPFDRDDQWDLREAAEDLLDLGADVVISNAPSVREIYTDDHYEIRNLGARRAINSDGKGRGEVDEVVITTVDKPRVSKEQHQMKTTSGT